MPGQNKTGPRGEGPLTGGQRGLCVSPEQRDRIDPAGFGVGRGGRPYGGGRGRGGGRGGGYGFRPRRYWDDPGMQSSMEQAPRNLADTIGGILDRLNELGETVAMLYDRFESESKKTRDEEEQQ